MKRLAFAALIAVTALIGRETTAALESPILVFGGTSGTGLETVKLLREYDYTVTVFVRPTSNRANLEPLGVSFVVGDALNSADVERAFASGNFTTVISSLGGRRGEPRPDNVGNRNITNAAISAGVKRAIQVNAIGAGVRSRAKPADDAGFMRKVMYEKTLGEDHLIASGLDYTIIRPGELTDGPPTGNGVMVEEYVEGAINRSDVALLILKALNDDTTINKAYSVIDDHKRHAFAD